MKESDIIPDNEHLQAECLFVYGTLLEKAGHAMGNLLREHAELIGPALLRGRLYLVEPMVAAEGTERPACYPAAVPSNEKNDIIHGELYRLKRPEVLAELDAYEECSPDFPQPHEYVRARTLVELHSGKTILAWIYFYNRDVEGLMRIESGRWQGVAS